MAVAFFQSLDVTEEREVLSDSEEGEEDVLLGAHADDPETELYKRRGQQKEGEEESE